MSIIISKHAGFCFGVRRAAAMTERALCESGGKRVNLLGKLIHNDDYIAELEAKGARVISEEDIPSLIPELDEVVLRSHGVPFSLIQKLEFSGIAYIDTTCPYVKKIHLIVRDELARGAKLLIVSGDAFHPEVQGIVSFAAGAKVIIAPTPEKLEESYFPEDRDLPAIMLAQTTQNVNIYKKSLKIAKKLYTNLFIFDTICKVTEERQSDCRRIAANSDYMLVIGGENSSNTEKLVSIAKEYCPAKRISNFRDIPPELIGSNITIGITAGASTPDRIIREVAKHMSDKILDDNMSFAEMLDQSFKTLNTGEEVEGVITSILPNELHLDLGVKHTGILPIDEITDDNSADLHQMFKVGDKITVLLQKFSDADGTVMVSKKRIDSRLSWHKLSEGQESGDVFTGKVKEAVRGGVLVNSQGQQIFIPASLTGLPKTAELSSIVGDEVKFKILEVDPSKHKLLGSIRAVQREEKKAAAVKFWEDIEVGKVYTGVVKTLTTYGAFVDLGGVDGMVHISELSWKRIKHPSEVLKEGDTITVFVKAVNKETKKISLGYKTEDTNPWVIFNEKYKIGDVCTVKIVSLADFGAFAEIVPGVDGLIHISQITRKRIAKPSEVLASGDEVQVEITDINQEKKKVSLSMRALLDKADALSAEAENAENAPATEAFDGTAEGSGSVEA
ncbi:MAG: bifunctional 4-hydroxy-3-methylbut-2-enyl diphosphate reductase/30S ribosomal protein S1 [Oscillospiraceae bacterium]|nr:bifunctional 4-hydroxy-3-methylbut-2-enyl diphosphate reductase/30S ribosomal protein S1 [Oscillospiraceae bacterium]